MGFSDQIKRWTDQVREALEAIGDLDKEVLRFEFDPQSEASIQTAIDGGEAWIDAKFAPYAHNPMAVKASAAIRDKLAIMVRERAEKLKQENNDA